MRALSALIAAGCFPSPSIELPRELEGASFVLVVESGSDISVLVGPLPIHEPALALETSRDFHITLFAYDATLAELRWAPVTMLEPAGSIGEPLPLADHTLAWSEAGWSDLEDHRSLREHVLIPSLTPIPCLEGGGCAPKEGLCQDPCDSTPAEPDPPRSPDPVQSSTSAMTYCPREWIELDVCVVPEPASCTFVGSTLCDASLPECQRIWPERPVAGEVRYVEPNGMGAGSSESDPMGSIEAAIAQVSIGSVLLSAGAHDLVSTVDIPEGVGILGVCGRRTTVRAPGIVAFRSNGNDVRLSGLEITGASTAYHCAGGSSHVIGVRTFAVGRGLFLEDCSSHVEDLEVEASTVAVWAIRGMTEIEGLRSIENGEGIRVEGGDLGLRRASFSGGQRGIRLTAGGRGSIDEVVADRTDTVVQVEDGAAAVSRLRVARAHVAVNAVSAAVTATDISISSAATAGFAVDNTALTLDRASIAGTPVGLILVGGTATIADASIEVDEGESRRSATYAADGAALRIERSSLLGSIVSKAGRSLAVEDVEMAVETENAIYFGPSGSLVGPNVIRRLRAWGGGFYSDACSSVEITDAVFIGGREGQDSVVEVHCSSGTPNIRLERLRIEDAPDGGFEIDCGEVGTALIRDVDFATERTLGTGRGIRVDHCSSATVARVRIGGALTSALSFAELEDGSISLADVRIEPRAQPPDIGIELLGGRVTGERLLVSNAGVGAFLGADRRTFISVTGSFPVHVVRSDIGIHAVGVPVAALEGLLIGARVGEARIPILFEIADQ